VPAAEATIGVGLRDRSEAVEIAVGDHGPGIAPADRERVLKRFVRLEKSRTEPGTGLGLSLVQAVARLHGGTVELEDNAPGLRVVLTLPKRLADR
jgi:signal transduction histidine kinase